MLYFKIHMLHTNNTCILMYIIIYNNIIKFRIYNILFNNNNNNYKQFIFNLNLLIRFNFKIYIFHSFFPLISK